MFIPSTSCTSCGKARLFDSSQSSTFSSSPGNPQSFSYATGVDSVSLPRPEGVAGTIVTDRVDIANLTVPSQEFLLCDRYDEFLSDVPFDGVMGIGLVNNTGLPDGNPWYWQLYQSGQLESPVFALFYPPGKADGAEMTLGGVNPARYTGDITYIPLAGGAQQFQVDVQGTYVNGKKAVIQPSSAILDSGTPNHTADKKSVTKFYAALSSQFKQLDNGGSWGAPCDVVNSHAVDIAFEIGSGSSTFKMTTPKSAFNLGPYPGQPGMCQSVLSGLSYGSSIIIGAPAIDRYYTVWDGYNYKMGFATPNY